MKPMSRPGQGPMARGPMNRGPMARGPMARRFGPGLRRGQNDMEPGEEELDEGLEEQDGSMSMDDGSSDVLGQWQGPIPRHYGPSMPLGANLRIQTSEGTRAGVIELRPGLFLVAEVPVQAARSEFGLAVLAPLVASVAMKALENPETQKQLASATERGVALVSKQLTQPRRLAPPSPVPWADEDDMAGVFGAEVCHAPGCACRWRSS